MLDTFQKDLDSDAELGTVVLHIVNEFGHEEGQADMAATVDLPLLQDTDDQSVWESWSVTYRDVFVLDPDGEFVGVYNLTDNDLSDPEKLAALEELVLSAMGDQ